MLEEIDYAAQLEHRTRSDLIREALRQYMKSFFREQHSVSTSHLSISTLPKVALLTEVEPEPRREDSPFWTKPEDSKIV